MSISIRPDQPETVVVGATFGLLVTHDDGAQWRWSCEAGVGYGGIFDPIYAIERETGILAAATQDALRVSEDECNWDARGDAHWVSGISLRDDGGWMISTATIGRENGVFLSWDRGTTLEPTDLSSETLHYRTLRAAPPGDGRAYVVEFALDGKTSEIQRSDDGGETWVPTATRLDGTGYLFVLAIDPTDPDVFYFQRATDRNEPSFELWRSTTGGEGSERLVETVDSIVGLVVSSKGSTILYATRRGMFRSRDGAQTWEPLPEPILPSCLAAHDDVVWACADQSCNGYAVAKSTDFGETWMGVLELDGIAGPIECPEGTPVRDECADLFPGLCEQLGTKGECPLVDGGPDSDTDADADGSTDVDAAPDTGPKVLRARGSGCDCAMGGVPASIWLVFGAVARTRTRTRTRTGTRRSN